MEHPAVQYETKEGLPGEYFRCERLRGSLSMASCAQRWRTAKDPKNEVYGMRRGCPIGAAHAGEPLAPKPDHKTCVRCNRSSFRLVRGMLCPSCANRQYEVEKGRNGKGTPPLPVSIFFGGQRKHGTVMQLHKITVLCAEAGRIELHAATLAEAYRRISRKRPGARFAWTAPAGLGPQKCGSS
jgi:hypothetical protein